MLLMFDLNPHMERTGFILRGLLFSFRFVTVNSGFLSSYNTQEEVLVSLLALLNTSWHTNTCCCFCSSLSKQVENSMELRRNFKSSLMICWHVPHESLDMWVISKWYFIHLCWRFCELSSHFHLCNL